MESYPKFKNSLQTIKQKDALIKEIYSNIRSTFNNLDEIALNVELISYICDAIEEAVKTNSLTSVSKLEVFKEVYALLFTKEKVEQNKEYLHNVINFLHDHHLIKAISVFERIGRFLYNVFLRKN